MTSDPAPRLQALDLFCGAGGAAMGLHRAGFEVVGVDIKPQKRYPFAFVQGDALNPPFDLGDFDFIWASPVCKQFTRCWRGQPEKRERYPNQIPETRALLAGHPRTCIENVPDAPLRPDAVLSGAMFDLPIVRERIFEINGFNVPFILAPQHRGSTRTGELAMIAGRGGAMKGWNRRNWDIPEVRKRLSRRNSAQGWRDAMRIDWMIRDEISQAIPPAYSEFIGRAAISGIAANIPSSGQADRLGDKS